MVNFKGNVSFLSDEELLKQRGLQNNGPVQKYVDNAVIDKMKPYEYINSEIHAVYDGIGTGLIDETFPVKNGRSAARFLYYGKVMVGIHSHKAFADAGEKKMLTDRDLQYQGAPHRGAFWFKRAMTDKKYEILKGAQAIADKEAENNK